MKRKGRTDRYIAILLTIFARGVTLGGATLLAIVMTKEFGIEEFGRYTLAVAVATFAALIARGGFDVAYLREHSRRYEVEKLGSTDRLTVYVVSATFRRSIICLLIVLAISAALHFYSAESKRFYAILLLTPLIVILTGTSLAFEYYKSIRKPIAAMLSSAGTASLFIALAVLIDKYIFNSNERGIVWIACLSIGCHALVYVMASTPLFLACCRQRQYWGIRNINFNKSIVAVQNSHASYLQASVYTYLSFGGLFLLAGIIFTDEDVGVLRLAERLTAPAAIVLTIINPLISARLAKLYDDCDLAALRDLMRRTIAICVTIASMFIFVLFAIVFFVEIDKLFGVSQLSTHVLILGIGQAVNLAAGPVGLLIAMANGEDALKKISRIQAFFSLAVLGTAGGIVGPFCFSLVYAFGMIMKNFMMCTEVRKRAIL